MRKLILVLTSLISTCVLTSTYAYTVNYHVKIKSYNKKVDKGSNAKEITARNLGLVTSPGWGDKHSHLIKFAQDVTKMSDYQKVASKEINSSGNVCVRTAFTDHGGTGTDLACHKLGKNDHVNVWVTYEKARFGFCTVKLIAYFRGKKDNNHRNGKLLHTGHNSTTLGCIY